MQVKILIGPQAGRNISVGAEAGRAMLRDGRAEAISEDSAPFDLPSQSKPAEKKVAELVEFAAGGIVPAPASIALVGEIVTGSVLPVAVVNQLLAVIDDKPPMGLTEFESRKGEDGLYTFTVADAGRPIDLGTTAELPVSKPAAQVPTTLATKVKAVAKRARSRRK